MDNIQIHDIQNLLVVCESDSKSEVEENFKDCSTKTILTVDELSDIKESSYDAVFYQASTPKAQEAIKKIFKGCKPGSQLFVNNVGGKDVDDVEFLLKTNGFIDIEFKRENGLVLISKKPKYAIGSSAKLNLNKLPPAAVWKLDDDTEEVEMIDPDNLLDEDDLKKPDPSSLKVCGTTGKRKACKDCSCGLADELAQEAQSGKVVDTTNAPKSSCGSCYLGDAFRCASCPYLGMPAFKQGDKIQLSDNLLAPDL